MINPLCGHKVLMPDSDHILDSGYYGWMSGMFMMDIAHIVEEITKEA